METDVKSIHTWKVATIGSAIFLISLFVIVIGGWIILGRGASYVEFAMWFEIGGEYPSTYIIDYMGVEIYPEFFVYRQIAVMTLLTVLIIYPVWMWIDQNHLKKPVGNILDIGLILGLLVPSVFIYGNPASLYRNLEPSNFELTGVISPAFNFIFTGRDSIYSDISSSGFNNPFSILGLILLSLAVLQIIALKFYEKNLIGTKLYLIPVILNVIFLLSILVNGFPDLLVTDAIHSVLGANIAEVCIPVPIFSIAILVRGISHKNMKSN